MTIQHIRLSQKKDIISWLDKQKPEGKIWLSEEDFYNIKEDCFKAGQDSVVENPEDFGLQKPVEPDTETRDIWEYVEEWREKFGRLPKDADELVACIYHVMQRQKPAEQKTGGWTYHDEVHRDCAIRYLESIKSPHDTDYQMKEEVIDWIKSLKDRVLPQPKREWSEEDESMLTRTLGILGKVYMGIKPQGNAEEEINWLKSLKAQPKQEWSEKEKMMVNATINILRNVGHTHLAECWFKSLKDRVIPQPKQESIEDDEKMKNLIYCIVRDTPEVERKLKSNGTSLDNALSWLEKHKGCSEERIYPYGANEIADQLVALAECLEMDGDTSFNGYTGDSCGKLLRELARKEVENNIAQWSAEDNIHLFNAILAAEKEWGSQSCTAKWLKSLKPQPKQEWSEEDEKIWKDIFELCSRFGYDDACRKLRSIKPQPHWKLSEEQIMAMEIAINVLTNNKFYIAANHLKSIYNVINPSES